MIRGLNEHDRSHIRVTDELLSAYIDGEVTPTERVAVEQALARDPELAHRLRTLQQTVTLLANLPRVPLPRAFTLSEADAALLHKQPFWHRWREYTLSLYLRGATAVAATLLVILLIGDAWWSQQVSTFVSRTATPAVYAPTEVQRTQSAEEMPATAAEIVRAPEVAVEAPAQKVIVPTVLPARQPAPEAPASEKPAAEEPMAPFVAEATAVPTETTPTPEPLVEVELEEEQPAPPAALGIIEPPGPEASGVITERGGGEPVPPGMGGGAEGGIGEPGMMVAAAERAYAPLPEAPMDEGELVTAEAAAMPAPASTPTLTGTSSPTATASPTSTSTLTGLPWAQAQGTGSPTVIPTATPVIVPTATPVPFTPTPAPVAMAPTVALAAAPAPVREGRVQMPLAQPGPFGLPLARLRALEVVLGVAVVVLGVASWLTRRW